MLFLSIAEVLLVKCERSEMMTLLLVRLDTKKPVSIRHDRLHSVHYRLPPQSLLSFLHSKQQVSVCLPLTYNHAFLLPGEAEYLRV